MSPRSRSGDIVATDVATGWSQLTIKINERGDDFSFNVIDDLIILHTCNHMALNNWSIEVTYNAYHKTAWNNPRIKLQNDDYYRFFLSIAPGRNNDNSNNGSVQVTPDKMETVAIGLI